MGLPDCMYSRQPLWKDRWQLSPTMEREAAELSPGLHRSPSAAALRRRSAPARPTRCCSQGHCPQTNRANGRSFYIYKLETVIWKPPIRAPVLFLYAVLLSFWIKGSLIDHK